MSATLLIASDHLDKKAATVRSVGPNVACALTPGEGPSTNPKHQPNEDSVGVVEVAGRDGFVAAFVADSHWGAGIGEVLVREALGACGAKAPTTAEELESLLLALSRRAREGRRAGDSSETTFLAAVLRGREALWASIADSQLFRVSGKRAQRLNHDLPLFAGADLDEAARRRIKVCESGALTLEAGEVLLLASDGLDPQMSGVHPADLPALLHGAGTLEERLRRLIDRARLAPTGGRDNVALVAIAAS